MKSTTSNPSLHSRQLEELIDRLAINGYDSYTFDHTVIQVFHRLNHQVVHGEFSDFGSNISHDRKMRRQQLLNHLTNTLYSVFYCGIPLSKTLNPKHTPNLSEREQFMNELSKANHSTSKPNPNWKVYAIDSQGNAFAEKNGVVRPAVTGSYIPDPKRPVLAINQHIHFIRPRENRKAQPVFYHVFGNEYHDSQEPTVRLYWNIKPEAAHKLIAGITKSLNAYKIPFNFKCLNHPALYDRNDAAVLYFGKKHLEVVMLILAPLIDELLPYLKPECPAFTDELQPGLGAAEDPGHGNSFGMHRASAIAEALVDGFELKLKDREFILSHVREHLKGIGLNPDRLSVNPHSQLSFPNFTLLA